MPTSTPPARSLLIATVSAVVLVVLLIANWTNESLLYWLLGFGRPIVIAAWIVGVSWVLGDALIAVLPLRLRREIALVPRPALAVASGFTAASLAVLALGSVGLATSRGLTAFWCLATVAALLPVRTRIGVLVERMRARAAASPPLTDSLTANPRQLLLAVALLPFLWGALAPPAHYDVLEYHLGGPTLWLEQGSLAPIPGNFYTALPSSMEALYTLGLALGGPGSDARFARPGLVVACLLHAAMFLAFVALAIAAFRAVGVRCRGLRLGGLLLLLSFEPLYQVASDAKNDLGSAVWYLIAFLCIARLARSTSSRPAFATIATSAGLALGAGLGSKITLLSVAVIPFGIATLLIIATNRHRPIASVIGAPLLLGVGAALLFAPWVLRATLTTGFPLFPSTAIDLRGLLPIEWLRLEWSPALAAAYTDVHLSRAPWESGYFAQWFTRLGDWGFGWLACVIAGLSAAALGVGLSRAERRVLLLAAFLTLAATAAWAVLGTSPIRFLLPVMPLAIAGLLASLEALRRSLTSGQPERSRLVARLAMIALVAAAVPRLLLVGATAADQSPDIVSLSGWGDQRTERRLFGEDSPGFARFLALEDLRRAEAGAPPVRVFLLFEARGAWLPVDWATVTVHDAFPEQWSSTAHLTRDGFTHLLVNEAELDRLARFYPPNLADRRTSLADTAPRPGPPGEPGSTEFYAAWLPWRANRAPDRPSPALLGELPALRERAVIATPDLTPVGHRVWLLPLRRAATSLQP